MPVLLFTLGILSFLALFSFHGLDTLKARVPLCRELEKQHIGLRGLRNEGLKSQYLSRKKRHVRASTKPKDVPAYPKEGKTPKTRLRRAPLNLNLDTDHPCFSAIPRILEAFFVDRGVETGDARLMVEQIMLTLPFGMPTDHQLVGGPGNFALVQMGPELQDMYYDLLSGQRDGLCFFDYFTFDEPIQSGEGFLPLWNSSPYLTSLFLRGVSPERLRDLDEIMSATETESKQSVLRERLIRIWGEDEVFGQLFYLKTSSRKLRFRILQKKLEGEKKSFLRFVDETQGERS